MGTSKYFRKGDMDASDMDEEYLDDPITLYDFEQIRFGCHTQQVKGTFFDIERNIELLEKCRTLSIQIVDCVKYPLYYKSKTTIKYDSVYEKNNAFDKVIEVHQEKFLDESLSADNIDDVQFQFNCPKSTVNCSPKVVSNEDKGNFKGNKNFTSANTSICQKLTLQEMSSGNSHIDFKKNRGLIGLKIIRKDRLVDQGKNSALEECSTNKMEFGCHPSLIANKNTITHEEGNFLLHDQEKYFKDNNIKEKTNNKKNPKLKFTGCKTTNIKETPKYDIYFDKNKCIESKKIIQETKETFIANSVKQHNKPIEVKEVRSKSPIFPCKSIKTCQNTTNTKEELLKSPNKYNENFYNSNILNKNQKDNLKYFDKSPKKQNNLEKSQQRQEKYHEIAIEFQSNITPKNINNHLSFNERRMRNEEYNLSNVAKSIDKECVLLNQQEQDVFQEHSRLNNVVRKLNKMNIMHENKNNKNKINNIELKNQVKCYTNSLEKGLQIKNEVISGEIHTNVKNNMPLTGHQKILVNAIPSTPQRHHIYNNISSNCSLGVSDGTLMQSDNSAYIPTSQVQFLPTLGSIKAVRHQIPHRHFRIQPVSDILLSSLKIQNQSIPYPHLIRRKKFGKKYILGMSKAPELQLTDKSDDSDANTFKRIVEGSDGIAKINSKLLTGVEKIKEIKRDASSVLKINHNKGSRQIKPTKGYSAPILPIPTFDLFFTEIVASKGQAVSESKDIQEDKNVSLLERPPKSSQLSAPLRKRKLDITTISENQSKKKISLNEYNRVKVKNMTR
ncbi:unnamed protein product [Parnassius apollo]|uniref:(apollo) hypothetical protein n=1 Tax=Parnassius apollo TaxID=110799 RepID=A0A8S3YBP2_PARAO|nr:unnamed protein product [Parnassius apollo]